MISADWKGRRCRPGEIRRILENVERHAPCGAPRRLLEETDPADVEVCPWCGRRPTHRLCDLGTGADD